MIESKLNIFNVNNKRIFLRADLNVPIINGKIRDDFRLQAVKPTIDLILSKGGKLFLITHIGRPNGRDESLSTKQLIPWFENYGYQIKFASNSMKAAELLSLNNFVLFENIRFFPGEKGLDKNFAQELAGLADFYVEDAFATLHRDETSITLVPTFFDNDHKTIGLLVEKELENLGKLTHNPAEPFALVLGGGKVETKLPVIEHLLDKVSKILLGPALTFTFLKALGKPTGISLVENDQLAVAKHILQRASKKLVDILFPLDYQIAHGSRNGPLAVVNADHFPSDGLGVSIGPRTIDLYNKELAKAKTIFFNCAMGFADRPETLASAQQLLHTIAQSKAFCVVGGGDSVALARQTGLANDISFLSTGGGATLAFLAGKPLPGLMPFMQSGKS